MACLGNSRFYTRVVQPEKLCQIILNNTNKNVVAVGSSNIGLPYKKIYNNNDYNLKTNETISALTSSPISSKSTASKFYQQKNSPVNNNGIIFATKSSGTGLLSYPKISKQNGFIRSFSLKFNSLATSSHHHLPSRIAVTEQNENNSNNTNNSIRGYSSVHTQQPAGPVREIQIDPYSLIDDDLKFFYKNIRNVLQKGTNQVELERIASYYFDGLGKAFRPMLVMLMARSINYHMNTESSHLLERQRTVALFAEMIHSASLVHDDVIDQSDFRRGKPSVNAIWSHKKVTMAGDYILSVASILISRLNNNEVTLALQQISTDLVQGEFMQLGAKETENERFAHYLSKTYKKTASLIANSLKSVAILAGANDEVIDIAFQYGRNIGLAFQLVDDMLDFVSSAEAMGKPAAADLKLGLATAPVLFACEKYPELNPMIMRHFKEPGDVERAYELVHKSQGLEQTRFLARKHSIEGIRLAQELTDSPYQKGLMIASDLVINRIK
ncbi:all trans-polyprenyl-diphosphate synthase PDSS1 [Condylostylus longicornis]|uniref:all trans-polyprenyl-diphosphate synthase PDSS1 n=1 Tax=Condylostylus longicornis TaxID=2530218 RepID=UPI00244DA1F7|nr:all trans-polyprenyl-diphosphate synthase PDSS1 [Condylostylus longicornis]